MDHAKWTFSSSQLQSIVSQAIRKSSETSSIRLLSPETLQSELPQELLRLETNREDLKMRYKLLARKRFTLISSLSNSFDGVEECSNAGTRILEELHYISIQNDQIAEELHSVDEQISQLVALREVHSYSALAMALRKLNTSFAKQVEEMEDLRRQVETLTVERDAAWDEARNIAHDYDHLEETLAHTSKRSSRSMMVRKSTVRQAALRSTSVGRSQRSSVSSIARLSLSSMPSGSRSTFVSVTIPPVPPIPRMRPSVNTDVSDRQSAGKSFFFTHQKSN
jgi:chromosome segregation ATPase